MRNKIGSPALARADIDAIAAYVRAMAEPLLTAAPDGSDDAVRATGPNGPIGDNSSPTS